MRFVHFPFAPAQIEKPRTSGAQIIRGLNHPNYDHMAVLAEAVRAELEGGFEEPQAIINKSMK